MKTAIKIALSIMAIIFGIMVMNEMPGQNAVLISGILVVLAIAMYLGERTDENVDVDD